MQVRQRCFSCFQGGHAFLLKFSDLLVVNAMFFKIIDPRGQQRPHIGGGPIFGAMENRPVVDPIPCSLGMLRISMGQDHFLVKHRIRQCQFQTGFGFQKNGCQHRRAGVDPAVPVFERGGFPPAVDQVDFGHVPKRARLQQIEKGGSLTGEHDQIRLHGRPLHLQAVGFFSGLLLVDSPCHAAGVGIEPVPFDDHFVENMPFVGNPPHLKLSHTVRHRIVTGISLIGEQNRARCRLIGEQLAVPDEIGPAADCGKSVLRQIFIV